MGIASEAWLRDSAIAEAYSLSDRKVDIRCQGERCEKKPSQRVTKELQHKMEAVRSSGSGTCRIRIDTWFT